MSINNFKKFVLEEIIDPEIIAPQIIGHEVIVDGYGYNSATLYHHLNLGWTGMADAWYNLGNLYLRNGQAEKALPLYGRAVRFRPDHPGTRNNYGVALEQTGRLAEAQLQYEAALRLDPAFADAKANLDKLFRKKR